VSLKNIELSCDTFFDVAISEHDKLSNFTFENFVVESKNVALIKK